MEVIFNSPILLRLIKSAAIILITVIFWTVIKNTYRKLVAKRVNSGSFDKNTTTAAHTAFSLIKAVVLFTVALIIMDINGINVSSLLAGLGIASAIVGLALQDFLKDVIMGFHILTDDFFKIGDVIKYNGDEGEVISFTLRTTKMRSINTLDIVTISNRNISEISKSSDLNIINIPLPYETDFRIIDKVLSESSRRIELLPDVSKCLYKGTSSFEDSAIIYKLFMYCAPSEKWDNLRASMRIIQEDLENAGIGIPYNQLDVHMKENN